MGARQRAGKGDIGEVLGLIPLIKKIERIGDQSKNILYLAEDGADLSNAEDLDLLIGYRRTISEMLGEAADVLAQADEVGAASPGNAARHSRRNSRPASGI